MGFSFLMSTVLTSRSNRQVQSHPDGHVSPAPPSSWRPWRLIFAPAIVDHPSTRIRFPLSSYVKVWELNRQDAKIAKGSDDTFADDQSDIKGAGASVAFSTTMSPAPTSRSNRQVEFNPDGRVSPDPPSSWRPWRLGG